MKRSPLPKKRATPRRREGRVTHQRVKQRASAPASAVEQRFWDSLPPLCVACGAADAVIHHILSHHPAKRGRRDHLFVVRLCPQCHNMGTQSVHLLGSERAFLRERGVDLVAIAARNLETWESKRDRASYPEEETCSNPAPRGR